MLLSNFPKTFVKLHSLYYSLSITAALIKPLKIYCPTILILVKNLLKLPTIYPPIVLTFLVKAYENLSITKILVINDTIGRLSMVLRTGPSIKDTWCIKLITSVMDWISAGIFYVEEIIWNKNGSIVDEVFCTVSNKVGDYSQMLLISWMVSMR